MSEQAEDDAPERSRMQAREVLRLITQQAHKRKVSIVSQLTTEPPNDTGAQAELYALGQRCLKRAAEITGLNESHPGFFKTLATLQAIALFSNHPQDAGHPVEWTDDDLLGLWKRAEELRAANPRLSLRKMSEILVQTPPYSLRKTSPDNYYDYKSESLRKRLTDAYKLASKLGRTTSA